MGSDQGLYNLKEWSIVPFQGLRFGLDYVVWYEGGLSLTRSEYDDKGEDLGACSFSVKTSSSLSPLLFVPFYTPLAVLYFPILSLFLLIPHY